MRLRAASPVSVSAVSVLAMLSAAVLAGCSGSVPDDGADSPRPADSPAAAEGSGFPLTLDNCGFEVTFEAPPERVVTIKSSTAEMMLALGVGSRIVGSAFLDGPLPAGLADAAAGTAVLEPFSERVPGTEATLALEPDLVYAGWESNVSADGAGDRATLAQLGVATLVSPSACQGEGYQPDPLTFDLVFDEIRTIGQVFGVPDRAEELVAEQQATLDAVTPDTRGLTALWFSSGSDTPFVGAGIGAPQMILDAVGLTNIAGDVRETWTSMGWEQVIAADPDVLVLVDALWNSAEQKIAFLESHPATRELTAVREQRYLTVPFPATEAGVRNADAVADLAAQLEGLSLGE